MKRLFCLLLCLIFALPLTACGPEPNDPTETVGNPFTSGQAAPFATADNAEPQGGGFSFGGNAPPATADNTESQGGSYGMGLIGNIKDDVTSHYDYTGGELQIGFFFEFQNYDFSERGLGPLIFLDGIPQPYKTEEEPWYSYVHILYPDPLDPTSHVSDREEWDISFIPVTGQAGDALELYLTFVSNTNGDPRDAESNVFSRLQNGAPGSFCRVIFYETPPELELPEVPDQVLSQFVSYVDEPKLQQWSAEELQRDHEYRYYINGRSLPYGESYIWPGFNQEPVTLNFQIYGNSYVKYTLVCFKNYQPVSNDPEDIVYVEVKDGQRTKIDVQIDMSDFDGSTPIPFLVALVPRNVQAYEDGTSAFREYYGCDFRCIAFFYFGGEEE